MSDEARNVELLRKAYDAWSKTQGTSTEQWLDICAEQHRVRFAGERRRAGSAYMTSYQHRDELKGYFAGLARDWDMMEYEVDHFVAQGDRVVMLGRCAWRYKKTGKVVWTQKAELLALRERQGGRVLRVLRHRPGAGGGRLIRLLSIGMNIFLAGATGVIGPPPGAAVARRRPHCHRHVTLGGESERARGARRAGVVVDVYDARALLKAMSSAYPDVVIHQLTDLPPSLDRRTACQLRDQRAAAHRGHEKSHGGRRHVRRAPRDRPKASPSSMRTGPGARVETDPLDRSPARALPSARWNRWSSRRSCARHRRRGAALRPALRARHLVSRSPAGPGLAACRLPRRRRRCWR